MYGIISSPTYIEDIEKAIGKPPAFIKVGHFDEQTFFQNLQGASLISLSVLLVDITCVPESAILRGIRIFRVQKPNVRVIIIAPGAEPGNRIISMLISNGIYDFVTPKIPEIDSTSEEEQEIEFDISPDIAHRLHHPSNFSDVIRWHVGESADLSFDSLNSLKDEESKKVKTKVKTERIVEQTYISIPQNTIGIVDLSYKAGSTFVSMNLAKIFSSYNISVSVLDNPIYKKGKVYLFDYLGIDAAPDEEESDLFYSVPHMIHQNKKVERERIYSKDDIHWLVTDYQKGYIKDWTYEQVLKYIHLSKSLVTILDLGRIEKSTDESFYKILSELDLVLVIVDPLPQEMLANIEQFQEYNNLLNNGGPIKFVFNKWNQGVNDKLLKEVGMNIKDSVKIPFIEPSLIYKSGFDSLSSFTFPYEIEEVKKQLEEPLFQLMKMVIPSIQRKEEPVKTGFLNTLFKKKERKAKWVM